MLDGCGTAMLDPSRLKPLPNMDQLDAFSRYELRLFGPGPGLALLAGDWLRDVPSAARDGSRERRGAGSSAGGSRSWPP